MSTFHCCFISSCVFSVITVHLWQGGYCWNFLNCCQSEICQMHELITSLEFYLLVTSFVTLTYFQSLTSEKAKWKLHCTIIFFFSFASSDAIEFNLAYLWHASKRSCTKCFFCCCFVLKETIAEFLYLDKNVNVGYFSEAVCDLSNFAQW